MKLVNIYTDGACSGNQNDTNIGGWGAVLEFAGKEKELCGGEINTTNNKMELTALLSALSALKEDGLNLRIFSDSSYLVNCFKQEWYVKWQKNGWKNSKKDPVENREIWEKLIELLSKHTYTFYLVKGHISNPTQSDYKKFCEHNGSEYSFDQFKLIIDYNNRCDALANVFIKEN
ncbi:MAG: ribonuclease HI [Clostridia bacterium]|nr:ribonuclease HI [Clostridia bacterium]